MCWEVYSPQEFAVVEWLPDRSSRNTNSKSYPWYTGLVDLGAYAVENAPRLGRHGEDAPARSAMMPALCDEGRLL